MKPFMTYQKSLAACAAEIIIGVLLLIDPVGFTNIICTLIGIGMALYGLVSVIGYFRDPAEEAIRGNKLSIGILLTVLGVFLAVNNSWLAGLFPALTLLYGLVMIVLSIVKLQWAVDHFRVHVGRWFIPALDAALTMILGIIAAVNPFGMTLALWTFIGVSLIVCAVGDLVSMIMVRKFIS